jgi:predicted O-methyltransferase YrrM
MDELEKELSNNADYYTALDRSVRASVKGRICHQKVRILNALVKLYPIQTYLEIGIHNGTSMSYIVNQPYRPITCIGVDLFSDTIQRYAHDKLQIDRTRQNIQAANSSKSSITLIKGNSRTASTVRDVSTVLNGRPLDLLFLDGDHEFAGVEADFLIYSPLVRPGGFIVFDDVNSQYPGILKCIETYIQNSPEYESIGLYENTDLVVQKRLVLH